MYSENRTYHSKFLAVESDTMSGTTITWAKYCEEGIWIVQEGTGALLLVKPGHNKILKYGPFPGAWCDNITTLQFVYAQSLFST